MQNITTQQHFDSIYEYCRTHAVIDQERGMHRATITFGFPYNPQPLIVAGLHIDSPEMALVRLTKQIFLSTFLNAKISRIIHP